MSKTIYLINPASDFPSYFSAEVYAAQGFKGAAFIADLATPTVAAMAPKDFSVHLCDESISPVDLDFPCDYVGITGKVTQNESMLRLAREFRRRGKTVMMGGPHASLSPECLRPHCDILVQGEIEEVAEELFADLRSSRWKEQYIGGRPQLGTSPVPKWEAYPNDRALFGSIQTSRGCPFECEFCDVIEYLGRKQRHKEVAQVTAELDEVKRRGYRTVFLADDNLTAYRSRAKELLLGLKHWNDKQSEKIAFLTQVSIDAAKDSELLRMCAEAGLLNVFIGIETPNEESLKETKKRQNLGIDLGDEVQEFLNHGIGVSAGMIVGFDSDGLDIFERQYEFAMSLPVPLFSLGPLVAPLATPLYRRMAKENRLVVNRPEVAAAPWGTNIIPMKMTRQQLLYGVQWLCNRLYRPEAFGERMLRFMDRIADSSKEVTYFRQQFRPIEFENLRLQLKLSRLGPAEKEMVRKMQDQIAKKPFVGRWAGLLLSQYMQIRHMCAHNRIWNPRLGESSRPIWNDVKDEALASSVAG
jgi:radical SAM superfamily enzyme YgiQ (UPF0313 family)